MSLIQIIDHRGAWCDGIEQYSHSLLQNTLQAFHRSFSMGHGVETDIRDWNGNLVVSHDPPKGTEVRFDELLKVYKAYPQAKSLALNIKSDGLQKKMKAILEAYQIQDYFVFDLSIPEMVAYQKQGIPYYIRESDYEKEPWKSSSFLYEHAAGVWIDQFQKPKSYSEVLKNILFHFKNQKKVCLVSPELHPWGRTLEDRFYLKAWKDYQKELKRFGSGQMMLCSDFPEEANCFFHFFQEDVICTQSI